MKFKSAKDLNKPRGYIYGAKWSEVPCQARACRVTIGIAPPSWWCYNMVGEERKALEVKLNGQTVYLDNEDGRALEAMLKTLAPLPGFRFMPVFSAQDDPESDIFYKAKVF